MTKINVHLVAMSTVARTQSCAKEKVMKLLPCLMLVGGLCMLACEAGAADGPLGSTSTVSVSVTANGPAAPRLVQVRGTSDLVLSNTTTTEVGGIGSSMGFCVVDTYGGATTLQITTTNTLDGGGNWRLIATSGAYVTYRFIITSFDLSTTYATGGASPFQSTTASLPAGVAVTSSGACGSGNLKAHARLGAAMPESNPARTYTDTITMLLSPN